MAVTRKNMQPEALAAPVRNGHTLYSHVVAVEGRRMVFVAGQLARDRPHIGHSPGVQMLFGSAASVSRAIDRSAAIREADEPSTSKTPIATGRAAQASRSVRVPRTADPALMTRRPRTSARSARGT